MSYINSYEVLDLSGVFPTQAVRLWWTYTVLGAPDSWQEADFLLQPDSKGPSRRAFTSVGVSPPPNPNWNVALSIQDNPLVAKDQGWIFRSGIYAGALPVDPIEVILAPEEFLNQAAIDDSLPSLPFVSGDSTITSISAMLSLGGIALRATGTNINVAGVTFSYSSSMDLFPNASISEMDEPLNIGLGAPSLSFAGGGIVSSIIAQLLNNFGGIITDIVVPKIRIRLRSQINANIIGKVATQLARQPTMSLPAGVVLSLRKVRFTSRPTAAGSEPVVAILGALGAFGGVLNKFPEVAGGGKCFVAAASVGTNAPEVLLLREFRDNHLLQRRGGRLFIRIYESVSPTLAKVVVRSQFLRNLTRRMIVDPAAFLVQQYNRRVGTKV